MLEEGIEINNPMLMKFMVLLHQLVIGIQHNAPC